MWLIQRSEIPLITQQPADENEPNIGLLPNEIWSHIFAFCKPIMLTSISSVCRTWYHLSNDNSLWKILYYRDYGVHNNHVKSWKSLYKSEFINRRYEDEANFPLYMRSPHRMPSPLESNCVQWTLDCSCLITGLAITILGALAIASILGGSYLGWIALGFGGTLGILAALGCCTCNQRCSLLLPALYFIVVGALGGAGVLSSVGIGWFMIAPALLGTAILCCGYYGCYATSSCWAPGLINMLDR